MKDIFSHLEMKKSKNTKCMLKDQNSCGDYLKGELNILCEQKVWGYNEKGEYVFGVPGLRVYNDLIESRGLGSEPIELSKVIILK